MANMSYCRFQNTYSDLRDCVDAVEELANDSVHDPVSQPLSASERHYMQQMIRLAKRLIAAEESLAEAEAWAGKA